MSLKLTLIVVAPFSHPMNKYGPLVEEFVRLIVTPPTVMLTVVAVTVIVIVTSVSATIAAAVPVVVSDPVGYVRNVIPPLGANVA